jgi:hypothetical protein
MNMGTFAVWKPALWGFNGEIVRWRALADKAAEWPIPRHIARRYGIRRTHDGVTTTRIAAM